MSITQEAQSEEKQKPTAIINLIQYYISIRFNNNKKKKRERNSRSPAKVIDLWRHTHTYCTYGQDQKRRKKSKRAGRGFSVCGCIYIIYIVELLGFHH